ncbi:MAG: hypothetical protein KIT72_13160 [Polyangiaceae bacterium]|nr:hypothetical protein [Polyangiaceae bacterium]MCW5791360.1 hypothetical protein [Polyangiaceae bacterium]
MTRRTDVPTLSSLDDASAGGGASAPETEAMPPTERQNTFEQVTERPGSFEQMTERHSSEQLTLPRGTPQGVIRQSGLTPHSEQRTLEVPLIVSGGRPASSLLPLSHTLESGTQAQPRVATQASFPVAAQPAAQPPDTGKGADELPTNAPLWMRRARELSQALEAAIALGEPDGFVVASVERAYDAFSAGGFRASEIAAVSEAVLGSYRDVRRAGADPARAVAREAEVLFRALPPQVASWVSLTYLIQVVSDLRSQTSEQTAMVRGTMRVLGWDVAHERTATGAIHAARSVSAGG